MKNTIALLLASVLLAYAPFLQAEPKYRLKIASLAPQGSVWVSHFQSFADEVEEKTQGDVAIRLYPGGVMGDDLAMYRKIRAGQLHGGGFTMTGIAIAVPDFRVLAVPFLFRGYDEIDAASASLLPYFSQKFKEKDLEFLALTEVGLIYSMSTKPTASLEDLRQRKSWIPSGDPVTSAYLETLNITPVPLTIPDVLSSLQTGLIDTVYTSLYGSIVMQWFTKATYVTDLPYGYAYGAVVLSRKAVSGMPELHVQAIRKAAEHHFADLNRETRKTNSESRQVLINNGVSFVTAEEQTAVLLAEKKEEAVKKLMGKAFSEEAYTLVKYALQKIRASK